jgi:hypothetical protein
MKKSTRSDIALEVKNKIDTLQYRVKTLQASLFGNFLNEFAYASQEMFICLYKIEEFKSDLFYLTDTAINRDVIDRCKVIIEQETIFINQANVVIINSDPCLATEALSWKAIAKREMRNFYTILIENDIVVYKEEEEEYIERNEHGDEFVTSCNKCGRDINSAETNRHGNCKNKCQ